MASEEYVARLKKAYEAAQAVIHTSINKGIEDPAVVDLFGKYMFLNSQLMSVTSKESIDAEGDKSSQGVRGTEAQGVQQG